KVGLCRTSVAWFSGDFVTERRSSDCRQTYIRTLRSAMNTRKFLEEPTVSDNLKLNRRHLMLGASSGAAALALGACSSTDDGGDGLLKKAQDGGTIRVAYANENPYAYTAEDGSATGQSVDTNVYLLDKLGISADQIEWKQTEWGSLITG